MTLAEFHSHLLPRLRAEIAQLFPAYFALVMATGIVSIGAYQLGMPMAAQVLFGFNKTAYLILWLMLLLRLIFYSDRFLRDISDHARSPGFLTVVAATNVLGSQYAIIAEDPGPARWLYYLGFALYVAIIYFFFVMITVKRGKPTLKMGINGVWLLMVVSTQSVVVLGTQLADLLFISKEAALFISMLLFFIGCMLYIIVITLIFYRLTEAGDSSGPTVTRTISPYDRNPWMVTAPKKTALSAGAAVRRRMATSLTKASSQRPFRQHARQHALQPTTSVVKYAGQ